MGQHALCNGAFIRETPGEGRHVLGGENHWVGAECPNCRKPFVLFFTLDLTDPALDFPDIGLTHIPLIGCPRCQVLIAPLVYKVLADNRVEIVEYREGKHEGLARDWREVAGTDVLSTVNCTLFPFPSEVQRIIDRVNDGIDITREEKEVFAHYADCFATAEAGGYAFFGEVSQVGGRPYLPQGVVEPECPYCKARQTRQEMLFLACLTSNIETIILPTEAYLEFYCCPECHCILGQSFAT